MYEREQSLVGINRVIRTYIFISFSTTLDNVFLIRFLRILITIPIVISETWNIILEKEYISTQHWNALFFEATYHPKRLTFGVCNIVDSQSIEIKD